MSGSGVTSRFLSFLVTIFKTNEDIRRKIKVFFFSKIIGGEDVKEENSFSF